MIRKNQIIRAGVYCLLLSLNMSPTIEEAVADTITTAFKTVKSVFEKIHRINTLREEAEQKVPQLLATMLKPVFEIETSITNNLEEEIEVVKSLALKKTLNLKTIEQRKKVIKDELLSFTKIQKSAKIVRATLALLKAQDLKKNETGKEIKLEEFEELKKALKDVMILMLKIMTTIYTMNAELVANLILQKIETNLELQLQKIETNLELQELKGAFVEILNVILKDEEGRAIELTLAEIPIRLTCIEAKDTIQEALEKKLKPLSTEFKILSEGKDLLDKVIYLLCQKKALELLSGIIIELFKEIIPQQLETEKILPNETKILEEQLEDLQALYHHASLTPEIKTGIKAAIAAIEAAKAAIKGVQPIHSTMESVHIPNKLEEEAPGPVLVSEVEKLEKKLKTKKEEEEAGAKALKAAGPASAAAALSEAAAFRAGAEEPEKSKSNLQIELF